MNKLALKGFSTAIKIISFQALLSLLFVIICGLVWNKQVAVSLLVGSGCAILPNFILACFLFSSAGATQLKTTMNRFYRGATVKLVLTSVILAIILKSQMFLPAFVFSGFLIALIAHVLAPNSFH
ncbi:ATP synthase subunit I [Gayadomonas joobiniege]|uniref:ATP synthase subunit I n=1 Tax=Gayadomonas joobiniege TaxID=1234606 RepID=UPI0003703D17|nr:ATP synthase subunit I [Gayadomonas joobiniege]